MSLAIFKSNFSWKTIVYTVLSFHIWTFLKILLQINGKISSETITSVNGVATKLRELQFEEEEDDAFYNKVNPYFHSLGQF